MPILKSSKSAVQFLNIKTIVDKMVAIPCSEYSVGQPIQQIVQEQNVIVNPIDDSASALLKKPVL